MEFGRKSTSPLEYGWRPGRLHQQTMTQGMEPFRETLAVGAAETEESVTRNGSGSV